MRIGIAIGITDDRGMPAYGLHDRSIYVSTCSDLAKQDWSPMAKLLNEPNNSLFGFSLADGNGVTSHLI
jgi:predicted lipoprotein with Yx(FWY)xxD motif